MSAVLLSPSTRFHRGGGVFANPISRLGEGWRAIRNHRGISSDALRQYFFDEHLFVRSRLGDSQLEVRNACSADAGLTCELVLSDSSGVPEPLELLFHVT